MRFNRAVGTLRKVKNYEGEQAYELTKELELYSAVVTSMVSDTFYEKADERLNRIRSLIKQVSPMFVGKLAAYAREKMYLRSMPVVLAVELAKVHNGDDLVSRVVERVVQRADEITEVLAYYQFANGRTGTKKLNKLSKQLQQGLAKSFNKFDEYQFAKYSRKAEIKLRDALFLVHPKAESEAQQKLFDKIASDTLATPETWEVKLSEAGQNEDVSKKETWEAMIDSRKIGYMATLRNLRNFLEAGVSNEHLAKVAAYLSNPNAVRGSKQLPFRFLSAYRELTKTASFDAEPIIKALESAIITSTENIKGFDENTRVVIATDMSGSMEMALSQKSSMQLYEVGLVLAMLMQSRCKSVLTGIFGDRYKIVRVPKESVLANVASLKMFSNEVGHSTNGYLVINHLLKNKTVVDKVMIFTDCQLWDSRGTRKTLNGQWTQYKQTIAPDAKLYLFDLAGYGNTPTSVLQKDVYLVAGFSDKVFDMLDAIENGQEALSEIEKIAL